MKKEHGQSCILAVTGLFLLISMTACTSGTGEAAPSSTSKGISATTSSAPMSASITPTEPTKPIPDSREGDDFGVVVNDVRYIVEDSFYADTLEFNVGSELYPQWQKIDAGEGSRFVVVDGIVVNESQTDVYPYAPITVRVNAEASDGSIYAMDPSSHAADERVVPKLHTLAPHYETTVRYVYTVPTFIDIEHMVMTPFGRYTPDQMMRVEISPRG